jgi:hypothetical protein
MRKNVCELLMMHVLLLLLLFPVRWWAWTPGTMKITLRASQWRCTATSGGTQQQAAAAAAKQHVHNNSSSSIWARRMATPVQILLCLISVLCLLLLLCCSYVVCPSCHAVEPLSGPVMATMKACQPVACTKCHEDEMRFKVCCSAVLEK